MMKGMFEMVSVCKFVNRKTGFASLCAGAAFLIGAALQPAHAILTVDVTGAPGSGVTTWTFGGSSTANANGTIRTTGQGGTQFRDDDSVEFDLSYISDSSIQNQFFALASGSAEITIGGETQTITQIWLDDDPSGSGSPFDDLAIRTQNGLSYSTGEASSWTGTFTVNLDINSLETGTFFSTPGNIAGPDFAAGPGNVRMTIAAVPEPSTWIMMILGFGLVGMQLQRKRRKALAAA